MGARQTAALGGILAMAFLLGGCASTPPYDSADCPLYTELGLLRANPAGQLTGHVRLEAAFRVCPPEAGMAEIQPPASGAEAPPGPYLLFLVSDQGVPSVAAQVTVTGGG